MPSVYVLNVPEFRALIEVASQNPDCRVSEVGLGYSRIDADEVIEFERRALGVKPAVWYGAFTGGIVGRIAEFGRDRVRIVADEAV
jgi:hypothetical protein